jgi:diguanylate cyclase (GGDEF)-like protein
MLGLTFGSLRRRLKTLIDQRFYPERQEMRRQLVELASELPAQGNLQRMGRHLVERLERILAVSSATLLLTDPRSQTLLTVASNRRERREPGSLSLLLDPRDPGISLLRDTGRPLSASRLLTVSPSLARRFEILQAELVVPLVHNGRLVGVLILGKPQTGQYFPAEEIDLLDLLGHQAATSFENVRLFESATYESLTGLLRREAILDLLQREVDRARRYGRPLSIGFADLDHFKEVNDRFGHLAGDNLLKQVAEELRQGLRSTDGLGRYGGEEFLLVFPETTMAGAAEVAEKLRRRIEGLRIPVGDTTVEVRISIGLALLDDLPDDAQNTQELIHAADKALYQAKEKGRNRVECAMAS